MNVTQIALGRFHHFHLARQLEARGRLAAIWSGYPRGKLADEKHIPANKIHCFPWLYVPSIGIRRVPWIGRSPRVLRDLHWAAVEAIDRRVARSLDEPTILVGLSSGGLHAGRRAVALGGRAVCDRGSTHIRFQDRILRDEFNRWGQEFDGVDPRVIEKEEGEYAAADLITVPSDFCFETFVGAGVDPAKIRVIPYGGRLDRFAPVGKPDSDKLSILFVGGVSLRKGIPYLLQAFAKVRHPAKTLRIAGVVQDDIRPYLDAAPLENVEFLGPVPNKELGRLYSAADMMVLPSLEEGLALVMAEAMACGCPVIASENSGARNLFEDGRDGLIVPVRDVMVLADAMQRLADDRDFASHLRIAARARVKELGGYDRYGAQWAALLDELDPPANVATPLAVQAHA